MSRRPRDAEFDAVVVGSGPNGLVGALRLAMAGRKVLVLERADTIGGAMRSAELTLPGVIHDVGATVLPLTLTSPAFRAIDLGPELDWAFGTAEAAHPLDGGRAAILDRSLAQTARSLGADEKGWLRLVGPSFRDGRQLSDALLSPLDFPPPIASMLPLARYGAKGILPAKLAIPMMLKTDRGRALFAGMAAHAVLPFTQPATTGFGLFMAVMAHQAGWPVVRGGTGQLAEALGRRLESLGGTIETGHEVSSLKELPAVETTLLDVTPRQLVRMAADVLPNGYLNRLLKYRYGPGVFKIDYALDGPVPWTNPRVGEAPTVHVGGTFEEVTLAEQLVAKGRHPDRPFVLVVQPSVADPTRAPAGTHVLWAYCHVPNGSRADMTAAIEGQIERFAPGFRDRIVARHIMTSAQMESWNPNLVGGDVGGGAADLGQFVSRPVLSPHPWATPLPGVYLCSASTPPGGGVHGMGGWHAAGLALR
jgi:phytoene dehydrogenase-like protein